jgi:hypothetical protein
MKVSKLARFCARLKLFFGVGEISRRREARLQRLKRKSYEYSPWTFYGVSRKQYLETMAFADELNKREMEDKRREREHQDNVAELVRLLRKD